MTAVLTVPLSDTLTRLASAVHAAWSAARTHQITAWEGYLEVGGLLLDARTRLPADREYGHWFAEQEFGFSSQWGARLIRLAENRPAVAAALESALSTGKNPPGVDTLLATLLPPRMHVAGPQPRPIYAPDHHNSPVVTIIVNFPLPSTEVRTRDGVPAYKEAERAEWECELVMASTIPDSAISLEPFAAEAFERFKREVRARPFLTMRR